MTKAENRSLGCDEEERGLGKKKENRKERGKKIKETSTGVKKLHVDVSGER